MLKSTAFGNFKKDNILTIIMQDKLSGKQNQYYEFVFFMAQAVEKHLPKDEIFATRVYTRLENVFASLCSPQGLGLMCDRKSLAS